MDSGAWLQRTWRPFTMIVFVFLVAARWLGLSADDIPVELEMKMMGIIQLVMGGYVIGRSGEKIINKLDLTKKE